MMPGWKFLSTVGILAATASLSALSEGRLSSSLRHPLEAIPANLAGYRVTERSELDSAVVKVLQATTYLARNYEGNQGPVGLFIAYYDRQRAGVTMHSPKHCLPGSGWEILGQTVVAARGASINRLMVRNLEAKYAVYYWYQSPDRIVASELTGKLWLVWDSLSRGHTAGSLVRLIVPESPDADQRAVAFASSLIPEIQKCLGD
ncbi:MAG TPA: EpsI family protein [Candidatus Acidoferrales bacterium]|jgi:EpsI family protein|nr:EpsI family protein [Candidatus Acidoferrales bacterium]